MRLFQVLHKRRTGDTNSFLCLLLLHTQPWKSKTGKLGAALPNIFQPHNSMLWCVPPGPAFRMKYTCGLPPEEDKNTQIFVQLPLYWVQRIQSKQPKVQMHCTWVWVKLNANSFFCNRVEHITDRWDHFYQSLSLILNSYTAERNMCHLWSPNNSSICFQASHHHSGLIVNIFFNSNWFFRGGQSVILKSNNTDTEIRILI